MGFMNVDTSADHYKVLDVSDDAEGKEIKKSFRALSKLYHPDRAEQNASEREIKANTEIFHRIIKAYEVLIDPRTRKDFDKAKRLGAVPKFGSIPKDGKEKRRSDFGMDPDFQGPNPVDERELEVLDSMDVVPWGMFLPTHKVNRRYIDQCIVCGGGGSRLCPIKVCGGCKEVAYCCKEHQRFHWNNDVTGRPGGGAPAHQWFCNGFKELRTGKKAYVARRMTRCCPAFAGIKPTKDDHVMFQFMLKTINNDVIEHSHEFNEYKIGAGTCIAFDEVFPMIEIGDIVHILCYGETCQWALSDCEFDPKQPVWFEITLQVTLSNRQLSLKAPDTFQALCDGEAMVRRRRDGKGLEPNTDLPEPPKDLPAGLPKHQFRHRVSSSDPDYWTKKGMIFPKSNEQWGGEWTEDMRRRIEDVQTQRQFVLGYYAFNERMLDEGKLPARWLEYREHMRLSIEIGDQTPMKFLENKAPAAVRSADANKIANAACAGDADELEVLLSSLPIELASRHDEFGLTPLHKSAYGGHIKAVMVLLAHGADVNAHSKFMSTALHGAAIAGHKAVVWLLLHAGADITILDEDDQTALQLATEYDRFEVMAMLKHSESWVTELSRQLGPPLDDEDDSEYDYDEDSVDEIDADHDVPEFDFEQEMEDADQDEFEMEDAPLSGAQMEDSEWSNVD